jgi:hypothetical protein
MKRIRFFLALAAIVAGGTLFHACQHDDGMIMNPTMKGGGSELVLFNANQPDCEIDCIDLTADPVVYYPVYDQETVGWGGANKFTKTVDLRVYNTETHFVIEFKSTHSPQNLYVDPDRDEEGDIVGDGLETEDIGGGWFRYTIELIDGWMACDVAEYEVIITGSGPPATFDVEYYLIGICGDCEDIFATAYAGNMEGENSGSPGAGFNNAWWYAFDAEGDEVQSIWAEIDDVFEVIGTATLANDVITLDLGNWYLQEGEETVKYYVYADGELPTAGRPIPGHATYKGANLVIPLLENIRYYVIHLDIETCR